MGESGNEREFSSARRRAPAGIVPSLHAAIAPMNPTSSACAEQRGAGRRVGVLELIERVEGRGEGREVVARAGVHHAVEVDLGAGELPDGDVARRKAGKGRVGLDHARAVEARRRIRLLAGRDGRADGRDGRVGVGRVERDPGVVEVVRVDAAEERERRGALGGDRAHDETGVVEVGGVEDRRLHGVAVEDEQVPGVIGGAHERRALGQPLVEEAHDACLFPGDGR